MTRCTYLQPVDTPSRVLSASFCLAFLLLAGVGFGLPLGCSSAGVSGGGGGGDDAGPGDDAAGILDPDVPPIIEGNWYRPDVDTTWQWQLQPDATEPLNTSYDVDVYDIDLFDVDQSFIRQLQDDGRVVICYFSAGTYEGFRQDAGSFDPADLGNTLDDFADERWLDVRSANVQRIMLERLDLAVAKGCDGVEPDNVDGYVNDPGFDLTATDQLAFNRFIANASHQRGLSVGLKNDMDQIGQLLDYFDFAVNEQCHQFDECQVYDAFLDAQKPVFNAEYAEQFVDDAAQRAQMCADSLDQGLRTLVLPLALDDTFRFSCDQ